VRLKRIVIEFRRSEVAVRVLYSASLDGPNLATKARSRERLHNSSGPTYRTP